MCKQVAAPRVQTVAAPVVQQVAQPVVQQVAAPVVQQAVAAPLVRSVSNPLVTAAPAYTSTAVAAAPAYASNLPRTNSLPLVSASQVGYGGYTSQVAAPALLGTQSLAASRLF